jgi:hypothetical protein
MSVHSSIWTQIFITSCFHRPLKLLHLESQNSPKRSEKFTTLNSSFSTLSFGGSVSPSWRLSWSLLNFNFFFYFLEMFKSAKNSSCSLIGTLLYLLPALQLALSSFLKEMNNLFSLTSFGNKGTSRMVEFWVVSPCAGAYCRLIPVFWMYILPRPSRLCKLRIYPQETIRLLLLFHYKSAWLNGTGWEWLNSSTGCFRNIKCWNRFNN